LAATRNRFPATARLIPLLAVVAVWAAIPVGLARAEYPDKPIVIIVHAKPGGAIDLTARMVAKVARNYTKTPLVIENRYGGSGAVAMRAVLGKTPDGYHVLAFPATFISTIKVTRSKIDLADFRFLACMVRAPEALITNRNAAVVTIQDIVRDAKTKQGRQIWVGPGVGSLDHLMAIKTWDKLGITATWLPYDGGGEAVAALLGGHGTVYVGNPEDVRGRPDLQIAGISTQERLDRFPDVPTLLESGCDLPDEIMWRGFAVHKDTPEAICDWLTNLLREVSHDPEWINFVANNSAENVFYERNEFTALVARDSHDSVKYLRMASIIAGEPDRKAHRKRLLGWLLVPLTLIAVILFGRTGSRRLTGQAGIAAATLALSFLFLLYALSFPPPTNGHHVGPASIPIIWSLVLIIFSVAQITGAFLNPPENPRGRVGLVLVIAALMILFVGLLPVIGFYLSTLILLTGGIYAMGYRKYSTIGLLTAGTLLFCWFVFAKTLGLPLPAGSIFG